MNKKLLTLAVASALAVPAIASAEAILYGKVNVSLDYIDVQQNATFFRPGQPSFAPAFNVNTFTRGTANQDALTTFNNLGSYPNRPTAVGANPYLANPWKSYAGANPPNDIFAQPGMPAYGLGSRTTALLNAGARDTYYAQALTTLRNAYPRNSQLVAQVAGWNAVLNGYGSPVGDLTNGSLIQNATIAGNNAYTTRISQGASVEQARLAASQAYDAYFLPFTNQLQQYVDAAENAAFLSEGGRAGATNLATYFAGERTRLTNDLALGNITSEFYNQRLARLTNLERIGYAAAATASFRAGRAYKGWGLDTANAVNGPASRVGVKGSEDLGNGLKAVYQIEIGVDLSNANRDAVINNGNRADGFSFRNTFVGLAGDWGTVLFGRHDTPFKISTGKLDLFADTLADYNQTIGFQDLRVDNAVAYISPSFNGFQIAAAFVPQNGANPLGVADPNADSIAGAWSAAAIYKNGPFYGSVAFESLNSSNWETQDLDYQALYGQNAKTDSKVRIGLGLLDWNGFSLTAIYEQRQNIMGAPTQSNGNFFQVQGGYAFGNSMVKAMWGRADLDKCADPNNVGFRYTCQASALGQFFADSILVDNKEKSAWAIGYDYNFSKRTMAYALYTNVSDKIEDADWSGFSIGMMHSF